jgi:hypothetical protein
MVRTPIRNPDMAHTTTKERGTWQAELNDVGGWHVTNENYDGELVAANLDEGQADVALELLDGDFLDVNIPIVQLRGELAWALDPKVCEVCDKVFARAQFHNDRCPDDLS